MIKLLKPTPQAEAGLTPAEQSVLELLCSGMSNKEIASALGKAGATVKNQISSILHKTGVQSRCQLMAHYYQDRRLGPAPAFAAERGAGQWVVAHGSGGAS